MSLLMRNATVGTRYGGGFVQSIDGLSGGRKPASRSTGSTTSTASRRPRARPTTNVHPGDHIWWDRHDWSQTDDVPAVVGSFPEPFLNGIDGKRLPVRVECAERRGAACRTVHARLRALGVPAARRCASAAAAEPETLRVVVGRGRAASAAT